MSHLCGAIFFLVTDLTQTFSVTQLFYRVAYTVNRQINILFSFVNLTKYN